ncbi:Ldh family oxidoreductase [Pseudomonas sp. Fl5BN2]|uniref:Ldh family oxidoreductase n=1 Tax=unclassified Pseudomonas TaxID=196821 RepID=UPI00137783FD|nr:MULTISPECIES: Ldh family oxidoreductase [unclassified Pseudomonas]NBF03687.1 Ldh family oxidoreductase [Pseudomonas sp. Fl5BN2]NBF10457.1 Ldh family oxidoreductase [Pseudomonas sp. Fl4BN1]
MRYTPQQAHQLAKRLAIRVGASEAVADALAAATVAAELAGRPAVGFSHLQDYLGAMRAGRIAPGAEPLLEFPAPALIRVDAQGGIAQLGFDRAFDELCQRAGHYGISLLAQHNSYTCGELGYYTRRLADAGLVCFAATNGPALMGAGHCREAVYCTNPLSFAAPVVDGSPLVIDQASSATAFVNLRQAAENGTPIPPDWALDRHGRPTTDAREAINGLLLAFGGARGANIALMVEVLAAGLSGAHWSLDAPSFIEGSQCPGAGLLIIALQPELLAADFATRLSQQLLRLKEKGIHIPGRQTARLSIELSAALLHELEH